MTCGAGSPDCCHDDARITLSRILRAFQAHPDAEGHPTAVIDFRYHIVSLISVFLALSIGIVLGAGPLKDAIGDQLSGQVDSLRVEKEQLRATVDKAETDLSNRDAFLQSISGQLLEETMPGRRVALVSLEEIPASTLEAITAQLSAAGARVSVRAELTKNWASSGQAKFRQSLASSLEQYLDKPPSDLGSDGDLAAALTQSLTLIRAGNENAFSDSALDLQGLLSAGELVVYSGDKQAPADMIVFLSAPPEVEASSSTASAVATERANEVLIQSRLALVALRSSESSVVVSVVPQVNELLVALTSSKDTETKVSTVARGEELPGQVNVALALAARATGTVGHYGEQANSTGAAPRVVRLGAVDRSARVETVPEPTPEPGADEAADGDDAPAEGKDAAKGSEKP